MIERNQVEYFIIDYLNRLFDFKYLLSNNTDLTKDLGLFQHGVVTDDYGC